MFWLPDQVRHDVFGLFTTSSLFGICFFGAWILFVIWDLLFVICLFRFIRAMI